MPSRACLAALAATLFLLPLQSGWAAEGAGTDPQLMQPNLIEVDKGRRLHLACVGTGSPTVVFEPVENDSIVGWRRVQAQAAALTRTCFYDRAGSGLSDPPKETITGISATDDLRRLLLAAKIVEPVVLVGHGLGGFYATIYADRFPQNVAGVVLVEPRFGGQFAPSNPRQRAREQKTRRQAEAQLQTCAVLARDGKLSAAAPQACFTLAPDLTTAEAAYLAAIYARPAWYEAALDQSLNFFPHGDAKDSIDWKQARLARRVWGATPLLVLSAETSPRDKGQNDAAYREAAERWKAGHRDVATRSSKGQWKVVPASGHFVQLDQPGAVIDAIGVVVADARAARPNAAETHRTKPKSKPKPKRKAR